MTEHEVTMPKADPNDPYALPALMPSSADRAPRSFSPDVFKMPTRRQEDWRFTPVDRIEEFFQLFEASGTTKVTVSSIDGSALSDSQVDVRRVAKDVAPSGTVSKPNDRASSVEWASAK
ncbi:MAG: Fe-S cluster assembly protein SufD, partial [Bifidobacterium psychraerophilum]